MAEKKKSMQVRRDSIQQDTTHSVHTQRRLLKVIERTAVQCKAFVSVQFLQCLYLQGNHS